MANLGGRDIRGRATARIGGRLLALSAIALCIATAPGVEAATYKWVDDKGVVHYTDKIPPESVNKGNVELNKQGVTVKRVDPALTAEQRRAREAEAERQRELAKAREYTDRRDRALLATYTNEGEIDLARSRSLSTIEAQVQSSTSYSALLTKRKAELEARKAEQGDKPVAVVVERELTNINSELAKQVELLVAKKKEIEVVNARYDNDKQRWAELRKSSESSGSITPSAIPTTAKQ